MQLRVATWNMAHRARAWNYLDALAADVTLLQESTCPKPARDCCLWRSLGDTRRWGSAIVTSGRRLTPVPLKRNDYPGSLVAADLHLRGRAPIVVVSMYGQLDEHGYSMTSLHRMLSDLTHLLEGKLRKGGKPRVILGGDLNASPQWDDQYRTRSHRNFFQRLESLGLTDCQGAFTAERPRTLRHTTSRLPWVIDWIFASESLARKVTGHTVVESPEMLSLSDHNPVVVTFEL